VTTQTLEKTLDRFYSKTQVSAGTDCLKWVGAINSQGYGNFWYEGKTVSAHRFIFVMRKNDGEWLDRKLVVRHTCDTRDCTNIDHLISGTYGDNLQDAWDRNRRSRTLKRKSSAVAKKWSEHAHDVGLDDLETPTLEQIRTAQKLAREVLREQKARG